MGLEAFSLEEKLALVTGVGTCIGWGTSNAFIAAGARLVITCRRENILKDAIARVDLMANYRVNDITERDKNPTMD